MADEICAYISRTYGAKEKRPWARYPDYRTFKASQPDKWFALVMPVERHKLGLPGEGMIWVINLKADPDFIMLAAGSREGILPAYHMNRKHWISVLLDGSLPADLVRSLIETSYQLVTDTPTKRIYEAVRKIPRGKVATYAQVAAMAGNPKMFRAVGNALHHNPDPAHIPCHRVVNSQGRLSGAFAFDGPGEQAKRLREEGVQVSGDRVDLKKYQMELPSD